MRLPAGSFDQPLQYRVQVGLFLGAYAVAADFPVRNSLQIQRVDELVNRKLFWKVGLIAEHQERYSVEDWLFEKGMKLLASDRERLGVGRVNNVTMECPSVL